jgi:hypothetical protein
VEETIGRGVPHFTYQDVVRAAFKHMALGFGRECCWWRRAIIGAEAMGTLASRGSATALEALLGYVERAMRLNETGTPQSPAPQTEGGEVRRSGGTLRRNAKARATSRVSARVIAGVRRITEAKREETCARRLGRQ